MLGMSGACAREEIGALLACILSQYGSSLDRLILVSSYRRILRCLHIAVSGYSNNHGVQERVEWSGGSQRRERKRGEDNIRVLYQRHGGWVWRTCSGSDRQGTERVRVWQLAGLSSNQRQRSEFDVQSGVDLLLRVVICAGTAVERSRAEILQDRLEAG